jgi:hypothetical protein
MSLYSTKRKENAYRMCDGADRALRAETDGRTAEIEVIELRAGA